jgi:predicted transcriptional regulator
MMPPKVSDAEAEILRILIEIEEGTVADVYDACPMPRTWAPGTVVTFIRRLEAKGYVEHYVPDGSKAFVYRPTQLAYSVPKNLVSDLLDRVFGGNPVPLVSHLLEEKRFTQPQIDELQRMIDEYQKGRTKKK